LPGAESYKAALINITLLSTELHITELQTTEIAS